MSAYTNITGYELTHSLAMKVRTRFAGTIDREAPVENGIHMVHPVKINKTLQSV